MGKVLIRLVLFLLIGPVAQSQSTLFWSLLKPVAVAPPVGRQHLVLSALFEGNTNGFNITDQVCCNYSLQQSTALARVGTGSLRSELRRGDPLVSTSSRSEAVANYDDATPNTEYWFGWSFNTGPGWAVSSLPEGIIQWHQEPDVSGVEPVGIWIDGSNFELVVTKGKNVGNNYVMMAPVVPNTWVDFVVRIKWDSNPNAAANTGLVDVWINGTKQPGATGAGTYRGISNYPGEGWYCKMGIYKWFWQDNANPDPVTQRVYYYDEFRIGTSLATYYDVAPGPYL